MHLVGDGPTLEEYKSIVKKYGIEKYCIFYGIKHGEELDQVYDQCDLGVECLANFRKGLAISSSLKSREYVAKGLPFIAAGKIDSFRDVNFVHYVSEDEEPINIKDIVEFYHKIYDGKPKGDVATDIRQYGEKTFSMMYTMREIVDFFKNGTEL